MARGRQGVPTEQIRDAIVEAMSSVQESLVSVVNAANQEQVRTQTHR